MLSQASSSWWRVSRIVVGALLVVPFTEALQLLTDDRHEHGSGVLGWLPLCFRLKSVDIDENMMW